MINAKPYVSFDESFNEGKTTFGDAFSAAFDVGLTENPTAKMLEVGQLQRMEEEAVKQGKRFMPKNEAQEIAAKSGVQLQNLPETIDEDSLNFLLQRQVHRNKRSQVVANANSPVAASLSGSLAAGFLDPLNVAASFLPIVGQARYAAIVAKQGTALGRAGARAGLGALEGAAGNAVLEPLSYALSQELGDDYGVQDSFLNIVFGGVMGGGLHMAVGGLRDLAPKSFDNLSPLQQLSKQFDGMPVETRQAYIKAGVAQMIEGRPVDVTLVDIAHKNAVTKQLDALNIEIKNARQLGDLELVDVLTTKYNELDTQLRDLNAEKTLNDTNTPVYNEPTQLDAEYIKNNFENEVDGINSSLEQIKQSIARSEPVTVLKDGEKLVVKELDGNNLKLDDGSVLPVKQAIEQGVTLEGAKLSNPIERLGNSEAVVSDTRQVRSDTSDLAKISKESATNPDSVYVDEGLENSHNIVMEDLKNNDLLDIAKMEVEAQRAMDEMIDFANQKGVDVEALMKETNDFITKVDEYGDFARRLTLCGLGKGMK